MPNMGKCQAQMEIGGQAILLGLWGAVGQVWVAASRSHIVFFPCRGRRRSWLPIRSWGPSLAADNYGQVTLGFVMLHPGSMQSLLPLLLRAPAVQSSSIRARFAVCLFAVPAAGTTLRNRLVADVCLERREGAVQTEMESKAASNLSAGL